MAYDPSLRPPSGATSRRRGRRGGLGDTPVLVGMFQYEGGGPYFIGHGGQGGTGPGAVGCTPMSELEARGVTPLIPVGHISWVSPLTSERGWLWHIPLGYEVFRDSNPPPHPKVLWVRTDDDCFVEAHGYLG
jgi:hypothetical protein